MAHRSHESSAFFQILLATTPCGDLRVEPRVLMLKAIAHVKRLSSDSCSRETISVMEWR
jgi:hypothetical protein